MLQRFLAKAAKIATRAAKRFLTNQPANQYEVIIFGALRTAALQFGRAV